jgi:hypothetical protein
MTIEQHIEELRAELRNAVDRKGAARSKLTWPPQSPNSTPSSKTWSLTRGQIFAGTAIPPPDRPAPVLSSALNSHSP